MKKRVESLGDRVLFLGHNSCMIVMGSEFPALKGNSIYISRSTNLECSPEKDFVCVCVSGVFNPEDRTVQPLFADRFYPALSRPLWLAIPPYLTLWREIWEKTDVTGTASGGICLTIFFCN